MNPSSFSPDSVHKAPELPPHILMMEQRRKEARDTIYFLLLEEFRKYDEVKKAGQKVKSLEGIASIEPRTVIEYGIERPLRKGSKADAFLGKVQLLHTTTKLLLGVVGSVDYHKEEAAVKLEALFSDYLLFATKFAELLESDPEMAEKIGKLLSFDTIIKSGGTAPSNEVDGSKYNVALH